MSPCRVLVVMLASCGSTHPVAAPSPPPVERAGVTTLDLGGVTAEVWYPSTQAGNPVRYDLRLEMPPGEAAKIPDRDNVWLTCDCSRDVAIDPAHPYPVIVFLHGAASFRMQSTSLMTAWAKAGFIVVAPDLPGVGLTAALSGETAFPGGTALDVVDAVVHTRAPDPFAKLRPMMAPRIAIAGHSLGAILASSVADLPELRARIALAGRLPESTATVLGIYGDRDRIAPPPAATSGAARVVVIEGAGHLAFTDLCDLGKERGGLLAIAKAHGVVIPELLDTLGRDGCEPEAAPASVTHPRIEAETLRTLREAFSQQR